MGNNGSALGSSTTAKQVIDHYTTGGKKILEGKVAIVTGGNSGIGLETCKALIYAGARVILCSRSIAAAEKAVEDELKTNGCGGYTVTVSPTNLKIKQLDLNSFKSIKKFADEILAEEQQVDLCVWNAGLMAIPTMEHSENGFEKQIGVNHFGHFYLTQLLMPLITKSAKKSPVRVVSLSSSAHNMGNVVPSDLHFSKGRIYSAWLAYGQSKQANILFAKGLADRTKGENITAVSVHPGVIGASNLWRYTGPIVKAAIALVSKSIPQGAATTVFACVAPEVLTDEYRGQYLADCHIKTPDCDCAIDADGTLRKEFWKVSEEETAAAVKAM